MATTRDIRVLALQALYALDMADGREPDAIRALVEREDALSDLDDASARASGASSPAPRPAFTPAERRRAFDMAKSAWDARGEADAFFADLAPTWPANRQPVIDRSILRLAWREMHGGKTPARVVVDEAIELARAFSTDKSPAFVNALLDKALRAFEAPADDDVPEDGADGPAEDPADGVARGVGTPPSAAPSGSSSTAPAGPTES